MIYVVVAFLHLEFKHNLLWRRDTGNPGLLSCLTNHKSCFTVQASDWGTGFIQFCWGVWVSTPWLRWSRSDCLHCGLQPSLLGCQPPCSQHNGPSYLLAYLCNQRDEELFIKYWLEVILLYNGRLFVEYFWTVPHKRCPVWKKRGNIFEHR